MVQQLVAGVHRFKHEVFRGQQELFAKLASGQEPQAAERLRDFHERRISAAPLLTEAEQVQAGAG